MDQAPHRPLARGDRHAISHRLSIPPAPQRPIGSASDYLSVLELDQAPHRPLARGDRFAIPNRLSIPPAPQRPIGSATDQFAVLQFDQAQQHPLARGDRSRTRHVGHHCLLQTLAQLGRLPRLVAIQQRLGRRQAVHHTQKRITRDQCSMGGLELRRLGCSRPLQL